MTQRIGLQQIRSLSPGATIWDSSVTGFGARRQLGNAVSYFLFYRTREGRQRWYTIGRHGSPWTPDEARQEARRLLGVVAGGADPAADKRAGRNAATVSALCDLYLADIEAGRVLTRQRTAKKAGTLKGDRSRIERHIKPLLGTLKVAAVTRQDIDNFMHAVAEGKSQSKTAKRVRGGKTAASRTVGLLGAIFAYAVQRRMRLDNPARGIVRFEDGRRDRRLSDDEYQALGKALQKAEAAKLWAPAVAVAWFLLISGWRSGEALHLRWPEIDFRRRTATLGDTKTGRSIRPLSNAACDVLRRLTPSDNGLVFPATRGNAYMFFPKFWPRIIKLGGLPTDITPHVLRHSFASLCGDLGYSESTIAALVGHKRHTSTSRYVHVADAVLLAAADAVAERTLQLMHGVVTQLRPAIG